MNEIERPWRSDPALVGKFHPSYPDHLQVLVHDGEPRRTAHQPELCWVRVVAEELGPERPALAHRTDPPQRHASRRRSTSGRSSTSRSA